MRIVGDGGQSVGKFLRIGIPVAHAAKPAGIEVEHLKPSSAESRIMRRGECFVHLHAAAPAVVHESG